jgi:4-amino-4-deoxy-L-arabinose transferase-like glycosyltransferase
MASYALGSAEGEYSGPIFFNGVVYPDGELGATGWIFYPLVFLWRSTPLVLIGLVLAVLAFFSRQLPSHQRTIALVFVFSLAFILFMTIAGKKFDRYLLPALLPLILIAGWGWAQLAARLQWLQRSAWRAPAFLGAIAALQLASALPTFPYYLSYYNPLLGGSARASQTMMIGWGEGLDQAADYLNHQPDVQPGDAAAWYSVSFNLLTSAAADDIPIKLSLTQAELDALLAKEYLVIYVHQWQRGTPQNLLDALADLEPEHRVVINGIEYVRVYMGER